MKKILLAILVLSNIGAFAANASASVVNDSQQSYQDNNPLVGGRQQSSHQQFGNQPITGTKGQKYNYGDDINGNNPLVGGRQQSSHQQFGNQPIIGSDGQRPRQTGGGQQNNPLVGGRQSSSDQVFGNPGQ